MLLAGMCENRTHQGRDNRPTTGFEDQGHHQAPSTPISHYNFNAFKVFSQVYSDYRLCH